MKLFINRIRTTLWLYRSYMGYGSVDDGLHDKFWKALNGELEDRIIQIYLWKPF